MSCPVNLEVYVGDPLDPLIIGYECVRPGLFWNELVLPEWEYRYNYAPPSAWVPGNVLLSAVEESSTVTMKVVAMGATLADLEVQKARLGAALAFRRGEFKAVATDGLGPVNVGGPWPTIPTKPRWGGVTPTSLRMFYAEADFAVPVNPEGAP